MPNIANQTTEPCTCPNHVVNPSDMCHRHQAEYADYLDEQSALADIQEQYEAQVMDR